MHIVRACTTTRNCLQHATRDRSPTPAPHFMQKRKWLPPSIFVGPHTHVLPSAVSYMARTVSVLADTCVARRRSSHPGIFPPYPLPPETHSRSPGALRPIRWVKYRLSQSNYLYFLVCRVLPSRTRDTHNMHNKPHRSIGASSTNNWVSSIDPCCRFWLRVSGLALHLCVCVFLIRASFYRRSSVGGHLVTKR